MRNVFTFIWLSLSFVILTSCVGTIEESPSIKPSVEGQKAKVNFSGVVKCEPISQDKIDVYFNKGSVNGNSNQGNMVYQIFQDGNYDEAVKTSIGSEIAEDENGLLHMVVDGIQKNTEASFVVRAFDSVTGASDKNYVTCIAKTLDLDLPDFDGIGDVAKFNGIEGRTSLEISWAPAEAAYKIGEIEVAGYNIAGYNVYFGKAPSSMELFTTVPVLPNDHPTSYKFTGLSPGIKYYFKVNAFDSTGRTERNNIIKSEETNTPGSIEFGGVTKVSTPSGTSGYYTLVAEWERAKGDFNAYKVYAIPKHETQVDKENGVISDTFLNYSGGGTINSNDLAMDEYYIGITTDIDQTKFTIPGLMKNMDYAVTVIACEAEANTCDPQTPEQGGKKAELGVTSPKLATFFGLHKDIVPLDGAAGLSQGTISWDPPLADGVCEGIKIVEANSGTPVPTCPDLNGGACITKNPNCLDTSVVVSNLQLGIQFAAKAVVFSEGQEGDVNFTGTATVIPSYDKPLYSPGVACTVDSPTDIDITWQEADNGLFSNYLVIWKETSNADPYAGNVPGWFGAFESAFKNPGADPTQFGYDYKILPKSERALTLQNLKPDTQYRVMVKAYLNLGNDHKFDDNNNAQDGCKTQDITLKSNMLTRIASIGPSTEHFTNQETLKLVNNRVEVVQGEGDRYGSTLLEWNSFTLANGSSINEILDLLGASLDASDGYHVFRRTSLGLRATFSAGQRTSDLNNVNVGNGWVQLTTDGLRANPATGKVEFTDQYDDTFNPYPNQAKMVWYAIKFKLGGRFLKFANNSGGDMLFDVLVPPAGMVLQHRAIHNKKFCDAMGDKVQYEDTADKNYRDFNYRCVYDGLGSIAEGGSSYYDVKGHILMDRNTLSCQANGGKINDLGKTVYSSTLGECYVWTDKDNDITLTAHDYNSYAGAEIWVGDSREYYHLGTNNKYKLASNRLSLMPTDNSIVHAQYWSSTVWVTIQENFTALWNSSSSSSSYFYRTWHMNFGFSSSTINAHFADKDKIVVPLRKVGGAGGNFTNLRKKQLPTIAATALPTGKGFSTGIILNKDNSLYPEPSSNEFLDRNYETNTDDLHALGKYISTGVRPKDFDTPKIINNEHNYNWGVTPYTLAASTDRTCNGVEITEADVIASPDTCSVMYYTYTISTYSCYKCYGETYRSAPQPIKNITASTSNYLCQSHDLMVNTPIHSNPLLPAESSKTIRKRLLSARELTSSLIPSSGETIDNFDSSSFDDYGAKRLDHSIYLSGQALCNSNGDSEGKCFTNPDTALINAYTSSSSYSDGAQWPFFQVATKDDKYPDSEMYLNAAGDSFFWQLLDPTDSRNNAGTPLENHFGVPQYTTAHANGGRVMSNYPLSSYNPHLVLGQPLWCNHDEGNICTPRDMLTTGDLVAGLASEANKYVQSPIRAPATITEHANEVIPMVPYYNPDTYLNQYHVFHDYNGNTVTHNDNSKLFNVRWEQLDKVPTAGDIGAKCAVKLEFDNAGRLLSIDGIGVN